MDEQTTERTRPTMEQTGIEVKLIGENGNVFSVIGRTTRALKRAGLGEIAAEYQRKAMKECRDYDEVLALTMDVVEVS